MAEEATDYKKVIADLKAKRDTIDQTISILERMSLSDFASVSIAKERPSESHQKVVADSFVGMSITRAAEHYLRMVGKPARSFDEIVSELQRGGMPPFTRDSVSTLLKRAAAKPDSAIVKVGRGTWGLSEWYPGRPKKAAKKRDSEEANGSNSTESSREDERPK